MFRVLRRLLRDEHAGVAAYAAMIAITAIGAGAVAVDFGRAAVLRNQMQNAADARAMAAAAQLDGRDGARARATTMAKQTMQSKTALAAESKKIEIKEPVFYSQYSPTKVLATGDQDALIVEVTLQARRVDYFFAPILQILGAGPSLQSQNLVTYAAAQPVPFICHAPPLMICDYGDKGSGVHDGTADLRNQVHAGKQIRLKEHGEGNFEVRLLRKNGAALPVNMTLQAFRWKRKILLESAAPTNPCSASGSCSQRISSGTSPCSPRSIDCSSSRFSRSQKWMLRP